jgi:hypothetical protein
MNYAFSIPEPFLFNPLKHHLGFIREFIGNMTENIPAANINKITKDLKHTGTSVMDIYTGPLSVNEILLEVKEFVEHKKISAIDPFSLWTGKMLKDFKITTLSDGSIWTLKYNDNIQRFVHVFPARYSQHTLRAKSNTLKSAVLYLILIGKDLVTGDDLNKVRPLLGLSPVKDSIDSEAITEMIEILRA